LGRHKVSVVVGKLLVDEELLEVLLQNEEELVEE
jgi:hypothetical protein